MTRPLIKVCGMTQLQQVEQLAAMGVDYAGFIFYPPSPRYIGGNIDPAALKRLNGIKKTGVFVNATVEEVLDAVVAYGLDMIQLHGDETPELCSRLRGAAEIVKVFRITGKEDLKQLTSPYTDVADAFLFDTKAKEYGGTGKKFDWSGLQHAEPGVPYFLSGGIGPDDLEELKAFLTANTVHALDVNSKFETAPGIKDIRLLEHFLNRLHG